VKSDIADSFRGLAVAIIARALADIEGARGSVRTADHVRDEAMVWINGPECEAFCLALNTDYRAIREQAAALGGQLPRLRLVEGDHSRGARLALAV
jgi:hypothetical protein